MIESGCSIDEFTRCASSFLSRIDLVKAFFDCVGVRAVFPAPQTLPGMARLELFAPSIAQFFGAITVFMPNDLSRVGGVPGISLASLPKVS